MVQIILNGEPYDFSAPLTVSSMLTDLQLPTEKIAVECNGSIVPSSTFEETTLQEGDRLEVIHFIGGG